MPFYFIDNMEYLINLVIQIVRISELLWVGLTSVMASPVSKSIVASKENIFQLFVYRLEYQTFKHKVNLI